MDLCERNSNLAKTTNVIGTQNVVDGCKTVNSKLVYLSTSAVFDGAKSEYSEVDIPSPSNTYGLTKLEGEKIVQKSGLEVFNNSERISLMDGLNNHSVQIQWFV